MTTKQQKHRNHRRLSDFSNVISSIDFLIRIEKVVERASNGL